MSTVSSKKDSKCRKAEKQKAMGRVVEQSYVIVLRGGFRASRGSCEPGCPRFGGEDEIEF